MKIILIVGALIGFVALHLIKLMRLYLVFMEQDIPFLKFVPAYLRTTLVNLIIPFKLGEIYRIGVFSRITGKFKIGFFGVLTDRFFDTLALLGILLFCRFFVSGKVTMTVILLTGFLLIVMLAYILYPSAYRYLNRYIIVKRTSKRSMWALKTLEGIHEWYLYVRELVRGRYGLLIVFSLAAWILEFLVLAGVSRIMGESFDMSSFSGYISSILGQGADKLNRIYSIGSVAIMFVATVISLGYYLVRRKRSTAS